MNYKRYIFLSLLFITTFFVHLGALPSDIMEERNLVTAREMADDGHWMVPTMNGELRLEKPPLPTWVAGIVECFVPDNIAAQRSMAGIMPCLGIGFFFLIIRDVSGGNNRIGLLAIVVLMTMYQTVLMGRTATWDIYCHSFMLGAIYCLGRGLRAPVSLQWLWFPCAGMLFGLSFLSKGPVSFYALLLPVIIASIGLSSLSAKGKWPAIIVMIVVALVVGGWWYAPPQGCALLSPC
jgi:4-amino-4-deoxy-L-arabinose transferase-like glycosyltransferase